MLLLLTLIVFSCSQNLNYTQEFKEQTTGRYLYSQDELIEVTYKENKLALKWRGSEIKPIVIDERTFTLIEMNKKLRFVTHPENNVHYISDVTENQEKITYDYKKVADTF